MASIQAAPKPREGCGHFATNDALLCVTLSTLGFKMRGNLPISIVFDSNRIVNFVNKETGELEDLAHTQHVFEFDAHTKAFGRITGNQVEWVYRLAKASQKRERGDFSPLIDAEIEKCRKKCSKLQATEGLAMVVQFLYDQITNWNVYTAVMQELCKNPFLKFQRLLVNGIAAVAHPLEAEATTFKRHEKLYRGFE